MSYYLMHRGWLDHELFHEEDPFCRRAAWAWLIEHAAWDRTRVRIAGKTVELERGQLSYSLRFLAKTWGWGHERVRRFLTELRERDMIETARETGQTLITVCNYSFYQDGDKLARQPKRRRRDRSETNKKEGNQDKKDSSNLKGEGLGRCAPSEEVAAEDSEPPPTPVAEPSVTVDALVASAVAHMEGKRTRVIDPVAYERTVEEQKWLNWLKGLHPLVGEHLSGAALWDAYGAISTAQAAGSREATPRDVRDVLNRLAKLKPPEMRAAA